jgi:hypothetical protein
MGLWSLDCALPVDILSELLALSTQCSWNPNILLLGPATSFFFPPLPKPEPEPASAFPGLDKLLAPSAEPLSPPLPPLNPKKLSCGNGPDRVFILFNPSDDASIGDTCERGSAGVASFFSLDPEPDPKVLVGFDGV